MADDKEPRWMNDPPPGFSPDGTPQMMTLEEWKKRGAGKPKVKGPDGKLYTPEEWEKKQGTEIDLDSMSVEELQDLIAGLEEPEKG